jgi:predicted kinase
MKEASFTFGRFNPPTTGHQLLVNKLAKLSGDKLLFTSHSNDKLKNPLNHKQKISFLRKFFGKKVGVPDVSARTVFDIANELQNQGYEKVNMMVGSDRVREFDNLLKKYNGVKARHGFYDFKEINVISAGERDPDSDDVSGMSASKMRAYAEKNDYDNFKEGVPSRSNADKLKLFKAVKKGMGIVEETLPNYMIEDLITEGVYDPGIFKAVFLSGGPGSGKSTVVDKLSLKALGLKLVNTDKAFENGLKKAGLTLDLRGADFSIIDPIRAKAKKITAKNMDIYIDGRLGLIFDTTSADLKKVKLYKDMLDKIGYESKMIFVNASLQNALNRNNKRARKLPHNIVQKDWEKAQENAKNLKKIFGKDFVEVKNDDDLKSLETKATKIYSKLLTWSSAFPGNKLATKWKEQELLSKKS